jgi:hypothetical protein
MGDGRIFLKISAPLSLMNTYQIDLISAGSISLDSTFKHPATYRHSKREPVPPEPCLFSLICYLFTVHGCYSTGPMYFVFCRLYPSSPQPPIWLLTVILYDCPNTVSPVRYDLRGFVGAKKKTSVGFSFLDDANGQPERRHLPDYPVLPRGRIR